MYKIIKLLSSIITISLLVACSGGDSDNNQQNNKTPIDIIAEYAQNNQTPPTVKDYADAGVTGVTTDNIENINHAISSLNHDDVDEKAEVQELVNDLIVMCTQVITHAYNPVTFEEMDFPTPCAVPEEWVVGTPKTQKDYSELGDYSVSRYPEEGLKDNYVVYYPTDGITADMPVVLFLEGGGSAPKIDDYSGIMRFMASQGYFVVGSESGNSYDSSFATNIFEKALNTAKDAHNLNISKLAVMGHSQGGGQAFYTMKHFRDKGYGDNGSLVISIDGWFAFSMNQADLKSLDSAVAFIQMNGIHGTGTDPRIYLSIWNLLIKSNKTFLTLPHNDHGYIAGNLDDMLGNNNIPDKKDILQLIGALTYDAFTAKQYGYGSIPDARKATYDDIYNALKIEDDYSADCAGGAYNASSELDEYNIDYCVMSKFVNISTNPNVPKPEYLSSYIEPEFGSKVTRITDRANQTGNAHPYPKQGTAWNSDGSIIRMQYRLYDATTFEELAVTSNLDIHQANAKLGSPKSGAAGLRWSKTDPNLMYLLNGNGVFKKLIVNAEKTDVSEKTLIDIGALGYERVDIGPGEGNFDYKDRLIVFAAKKSNDDKVYAVLYNRESNSVLWEKEAMHGLWSAENNSSDPDYFDWITVDPTGTYILLGAESKRFLYDINLGNEKLLIGDEDGGHGDIGIDVNGDPVYVQMLWGGRGIWSHNLRTQEAIKLISSNHGGGHISCRNYRLSGWCYANTSEEGYKEVFAVRLDNSGVVNRFAQTHVHYEDTKGATQVNVSPDGTKVLFASDWMAGEDNGDIADTYHVEFK